MPSATTLAVRWTADIPPSLIDNTTNFRAYTHVGRLYTSVLAFLVDRDNYTPVTPLVNG
jgi:hypothetical protein